MRSIAAVAIISACVLTTSYAHSSAPQRGGGAGAVAGRVLDAVTGSPVAAAAVWIVPAVPTRSVSEFTDLPLPSARPDAVRLTTSDGRFVLRGIAPGRYRIRVDALGYIPALNGQAWPSGPDTPVEITGDAVESVTVAIWPHASLSGVVVDERGDPAVAVDVRCYVEVVAGGRRRLRVVATVPSDDRGVYRVTGLEPGRYVCGVVPQTTTMPLPGPAPTAPESRRLQESGATIDTSFSSGIRIDGHFLMFPGLTRGLPPPAPDHDGVLRMYPPTFYPGVSLSTEATRILLGIGEQRVGIDFALALRPAVSVKGTVVGPEGPLPFLALTLVPTTGFDFVSEGAALLARTVTTAGGQFTFLGVSPGDYFIKARHYPNPGSPNSSSEASDTLLTDLGTVSGVARPPVVTPAPTTPSLWVTQPVTVGEQPLRDLIVSLRTGVRMSGTVSWAGSPTTTLSPEVAARLAFRLHSAEGRTSSPVPADGRVTTAGSWITSQLPPGRYVLAISEASLPRGWYLRTAMWQGKDVSVDPVVLEDRDIEGVVVTLTDRQAAITGVVTHRGVPARGEVVVFPADLSSFDHGVAGRRSGSQVSQPTGTFAIRGLPPGEYYVAARPVNSQGDWRDPATLKTLISEATRIRVGDDGTTHVDVRLQTGQSGLKQ